VEFRDCTQTKNDPKKTDKQTKCCICINQPHNQPHTQIVLYDLHTSIPSVYFGPVNMQLLNAPIDNLSSTSTSSHPFPIPALSHPNSITSQLYPITTPSRPSSIPFRLYPSYPSPAIPALPHPNPSHPIPIHPIPIHPIPFHPSPAPSQPFPIPALPHPIPSRSHQPLPIPPALPHPSPSPPIPLDHKTTSLIPKFPPRTHNIT
jgi:hypothetical protein